ncbi:MAG: carbohydrate binding domain-containing protein [Planctomycetota bacterium]|nr:carbohydrate binding domain-containing protein [Planctomycetota bacterium]
MRKPWYVLAALGALASAAACAAQSHAAPLEHRWVYLATNLLVDKNVEDALVLLDRAAKAGYNGVVLTDSKFLRWDQLPERYVQNVRRVRQACRDHKLACIACVCPIGYANDLLSRDPNLAEGLPVVDAPFVAKGGRLIPADDSVRLVNGGFEQSKNNMPTGWSFVDQPGKITFIDTAVGHEGRSSLRMQDIGLHDPQHGHGRACQTLTVKPFRYYHVSAMVKTQDFESAGEVQIAVLCKDGTALNYHKPHVEKTQDWKRIDVTFNSLEFSQVNLYLGIWGGRRGKIWWDDVRLEPGGLVNVVRRDGAPLRATSADGQVRYQEDRDFQNARDPKLGMIPWPGGFTAWHDPPTVPLPSGSRIRDGQKVSLSYFHTAIIYEEQVMCCMAEPKLYEILRWQIEQVHKHLQPDGYFLQHDEIRVQGWDESCRHAGKTPGELLAENVAKCVKLVRAEDVGKPVYVWSDMFDPSHNAQKVGRYYLVKGNGPWYGSWKGLEKDVAIVNWNSGPGKRIESLRHFAGLGHRQILVGYYDGPVGAIRGWLRDGEQVPGIVGAMYTTWQHQYRDLEAFAAQLKAH